MITKKQNKAIELMFEGNLSQKAISKELGIHETTLSRWKNDKDFIKAMSEYTEATIAKSTPKALSTMIGLLKAKSELVRFNAAKDLLDRAGFAPNDRVDLNVESVTFVDDVPEDDTNG
ncbi:phBC6A51 family helix-turn-helix protein [Lapidilactobacillus bayanensis]|uniref:phBC6A51 family helix-turn-helix protein n=1 Tax=Lapidilactobacillus bayanensis TaxID=2485998 RepID=UPI001CDD59D6|nr:phBC6A51 family helix-turn-helix protein [Lapidilactobacillus bayanensis]